MIGEALALDHVGDYRDELLAKQAEALQALASRQARGAFGNINRLRVTIPYRGAIQPDHSHGAGDKSRIPEQQASHLLKHTSSIRNWLTKKWPKAPGSKSHRR